MRIVDSAGILGVHEVTNTDFHAYGHAVEIEVYDSDAELSLTVDGGKEGAVLYHGSYTNAPGEVHAATSTIARIDIAFSGNCPGTISFEPGNYYGKLDFFDSGTNALSQSQWQVSAPTNIVLYAKGTGHSATTNDILLAASYTSVYTNIADMASMTAVEITMEASANWPENKRRHVFGPCETFEMDIIPHMPIDCKISSLAVASNGRKC